MKRNKISLKIIKKTAAALLCTAFFVISFSACNSDDDVDPNATALEPAYAGILTKIRLGMTETKVISMLPDSVPLYYQDDFEMWSIDPDTNMQAIRTYLPEGDLNYYADDSIITYYFKNQNGNPDHILTGYMEEVHGVFPQDASIKFYDDTAKRLQEEYGVTPIGTQTGTEGIDSEIQLKQVYDCPSATVTFYCTYTWQNVNGIDDYFGSYFAVKLMGKTIKEEVALASDGFTAAVTATTAAAGEEPEETTEPPADDAE
ncbi:MAG: hypothetical protein LBM41_03350 [Ruminococcus sp.]|jgi:hypothetical protein|nr:hypothetical protein [Ruminococcus sp.]